MKARRDVYAHKSIAENRILQHAAFCTRAEREENPVTTPGAISCQVSRSMTGSMLKFEERLPAPRGEDSWPAGKTPVTRFQLLRHREDQVI